MENLAYLHLALAYETAEQSEFGIELEQREDKGLQTEMSEESLSISSWSLSQLFPKWVPSLKLNFLINAKSIALLLVLLLATPVCALLVRGNSGKEVAKLQNDLKQLGYFPKNLRSTGYFGRITQASVREFQKDNGLVVDGKVGRKTTSALNQTLNTSDKSPNQGKVSRTRTNEALVAFANKYDVKVLFPPSITARALLNRGLRETIFDRALVNYNESIKKNKYLAEAYYRRGLLYAYASEVPNMLSTSDVTLKQDLGKALKDFNKAIELNSNYAEAYLDKGIIHAEKKQWKNAIDDWTQVILIEPDNTESYYRRAKAKENIGKQIESAINDYITVIKIQLKSEPDTSLKTQVEEVINNYYENKTNAKLMLNLFRGIASASLSDIFRKDFFNAKSEEFIYKDQSEEQFKIDAEKKLEIALKEVTEQPKYEKYKNLFYYYIALNQYNINDDQTKSEKNFSKTQFPSAYYYQGILLLENGNKNENDLKNAKDKFNQAIKKEPNFTKAYYLRGIINSKQGGNETQAILDYQKYLQGDPDMEEAKKMRDYLESNQERLVLNALSVCSSEEIPQQYLNTLNPSLPLKDASAYLRRGKLRFLLGDYLGASRDFDVAIERNANLADAYYQKARVAAYQFYFLDNEQKWENAKTAKTYFKLAIEKNPNFDDAYFDRGYLQYTVATLSKNGYSTNIKDFFGTNNDSLWMQNIQNDFIKSIEINKNFAEAYYLLAISTIYKFKSIENANVDETEMNNYINNINRNLSSEEITYLTEAIRSDVYFYSKIFWSAYHSNLKRNICFNLENLKQKDNIDNTTTTTNIIPFQSQKEYSYYVMALNDYRNAHYLAAINNINEAMKINPDISDYYTIRGASYYFLNNKSKDYSQAFQDLKKSIELDTPSTGSTTDTIVVYSNSVAYFLLENILEYQKYKHSENMHKKALKLWHKPDWLVVRGAGGDIALNQTSNSQAASKGSRRRNCK
jgi:tetratricopeptide (TPR) repeat protein